MLTRPFLHVAKPWSAADVACVPSSPIHVSAFIALPVFGAEQTARLLGSCLADFGANFLFTPGATATAPVGVASRGSIF